MKATDSDDIHFSLLHTQFVFHVKLDLEIENVGLLSPQGNSNKVLQGNNSKSRWYTAIWLLLGGGSRGNLVRALGSLFGGLGRFLALLEAVLGRSRELLGPLGKSWWLSVGSPSHLTSPPMMSLQQNTACQIVLEYVLSSSRSCNALWEIMRSKPCANLCVFQCCPHIKLK